MPAPPGGSLRPWTNEESRGENAQSWWRRFLCRIGAHPQDEVEDHGHQHGHRLSKCYACGRVYEDEPWWREGID